MRPKLTDIVDYSVPYRPFTVRRDAPAPIIKEAKRLNAIRIGYNAKPLFHFEDESLNDDDKLDYSKPILKVM